MKLTIGKKKSNLDLEIDSILVKMKTLNPWDDNYAKAADNLKTLKEARSIEKANHLSLDTLIVGGISLVETVLVLNYEKIGVITSKAFGRIIRGRV